MGRVIALYGPLGAGKTWWVKSFVQEVGAGHRNSVTSPTFSYLHVYQEKTTVYHFDLYRLTGPEDFVALGFEDFLYSGEHCCIEWADRIETLLPPHTERIHL